MRLLVQSICDDPDHAFHPMDCEPDLEKVSDLTRPASKGEILMAALELGLVTRQGIDTRRRDMSEQAWCCILECDKDAEFGIFGDSNHFEDNTQACEAHVGALLGTPDWLLRERGRETTEWTVVLIDADREGCEIPNCRLPAEFETVLMRLCSVHAVQSPEIST